jgi:hypothetical protein
LDQGAGHVCFDVLLEGILCITGVVQIGVLPEIIPEFVGAGLGFGEVGFHGVELVAVHGADGKRAGARQLTCLLERFVPCGVALVEVLADLFGDLFKFMHDDLCSFSFIPWVVRAVAAL